MNRARIRATGRGLRIARSGIAAALLIGLAGCRAGDVPPRSVMVIGWDGATWDILDPLLRQGRLPTLESLLDRGLGGVLVSTPLYVSPPAWVSLYSGKNPGKTGIFHFGSRLDDLPHLGDLTADDVRTARLWDIMSHHGRRCATVNVPLTYPARPANGIVIADEFSPCTIAPHQVYTVTTWDTLPAPGRPGRARLSLHDTQVEITVDVFRSTPWMTLRKAGSGAVLAGPELAHLVWSPWFPVAVGGEEGEARVRLQNLGARRVELWLSPVYRRIEHYPGPITYPAAWAETLAARHERFLPFVRWHWEPALEHLRWLEGVCRDVLMRERWDLFTCVFLAPDHMQHLYGDGEETGTVLEELDRVTGRLIALAPRDALVLIVSDHGFAPFGRRVDINRWLADLGLARFDSSGALMPDSSLAWSLMWGVYLNERLLDEDGRERVIQRILEAAPHAVDPDRGTNLGLTFIRREDAYAGPFLLEAPHLLALTTAPGYIPEFWDDKNAGDRPLCRDTTRHTAWDHARDGIVVAAGPGVDHATSRIRLSIYDVAPSVLAWAGVPVARDMDGRVVPKLCAPGKTPAVTWCDTYDDAIPGASGSPGSVDLEARLRALGYVRDH